jgi:hypothetical protein
MRRSFDRPPTHALAVALVCLAAAPEAVAQRTEKFPARKEAISPPPKVSEKELADATARSIELLLSMQEGPGKDQWPYEGVYRVGGQIPSGYRVGGTAIAATALVLAPGYEQDEKRRDAVARAVKFIAEGTKDPLMSIDNYQGNYDVRAWGYIYALHLLALLEERKLTPAEHAEAANKAAAWYLDALHRIEMPQTGGWNYARPPGRDTVGTPSPFMTGPALQALFQAQRAGMKIDAAVVTRALDFLDKARTKDGAYQYAGEAGKSRRPDAIPGATGRMLCAEATLLLAGRGSPERLKAALDAFEEHWKWLDQRRQMEGTHVAPYGVAPYYFMFAHFHAAQAIELLPEADRPAYRSRLHGLLWSVRMEDGSWTDRVFKRTANYGTATALMAITMPSWPAPARWVAPAAVPEQKTP